ncbi:winged helix-turn-helix domain-containing protein [Streptomyces actuosus]|uniref:Winged helix-turn-helix domain-containing protein n=1 Tax=Streptomyces actuosus TaxID=1885 RepID=A0ABS2VIZ4_STRAS|nr:BTAD domain-containing putative transcriptional regulator [Streptomyces actuosus]MBN0043075.1 winged helix-turn-helix domain-containing protein [Streptomyces actuosus]
MRYGILGVTQAEDDHGRPLPVGGPRLRALLAALALRPGRVTAPETLIGDVWADDPPQDAPAALQALVARLRRVLGRDAVTSEPGGYRLAATEGDVDLHVFERLLRQAAAALGGGDAATAAPALDEALALWRGPALADLPDRTAATRAQALRLEAARARAEARLRLGRARDAVPELQELTAAHPYDEPLRALLLRALRDCGRTADALAAYDAARRTLADGLGADPGPELRALHAELLDPARRSTSAAEPAAGPAPRHLSAGTGNIRPRLTSFVGREPELAALRSDLRSARLVTLVGPGGSGKTRLAEEAAAGIPQAWLAELAPLDRPEAVPGAVVSALGLRETVLLANDLAGQQDDPVALLVDHCAPRRQLLILDNCEHVVGAAAGLAETLLTRCPGLTVLATSREPLGVPGEAVRPVAPLRPDQAHRLFRERAATVGPDAGEALSDQDAVAEICRRLDGLPLAIELAAARLRMLTPRQIADRLDDRFRLLTSGSRTVLPRQQTLRAVVDWSWDLLDEPERTMLCEMSVFAGGWDLAAAEAVCTGPVAELVGALVDKSLVVATPYPSGHGRDASPGMRYRMLETIHEYAAERAAEVPGLRAGAELRHRAWVSALTAQAEPQLRSAGQLPWIACLETELDNIRAALHRALTSGDEEEAGALCLSVGWFWWLRNYHREGHDWVTRTLRLGAALDARASSAPHPQGGHARSPGAPPTVGDPPAASASDATGGAASDAVGDALSGAVPDLVDAFLTAPDGETRHPRHDLRMDLRMLDLFYRSELPPADSPPDERTRRYVSRLLAHFERGGPRTARMPGVVWPLAAHFLGDVGDMRTALGTALAQCRAHGGDWEVGVTLMIRTHLAVDSSGGMERIDDDLAELRAIGRRVGDRWMQAHVSSAAGEAAMARSRFAEAEGEYREALRLAHEVGAYAESPFLLARLGEIAYRAGDRPAAVAALDEAAVAADRYGVADTEAFVLLLRAQMALDDKDTARARELHEASRQAAMRGTPPPQFSVMLGAVDALVRAAGSGPAHGLPPLAAAHREAVERRCAEPVVAGTADIGAGLLADLGDFARAARLLGAADRLRGGYPRPRPEADAAARAEAAARAVLGAACYAAEHARGAALTPDDICRELDRSVADHGAGPAPTSR